MRDCLSDRTFGFGMRPWVVLAVLAVLTPRPGSAQVRDVVSKEIAVGREEATLALELEGGRELDIAFRDGVVRIDGEEAGTFQAGSALEGAWRELLGTAVALDDGPLARALVDWEPPSDLDGRGLELARRIDEALESAVARPENEREAPAEASSRDAERLVRSLLERTEHLTELGEAMEGIRVEDIDVRIGEDVVIGREVQLDATLVAVGSDVVVQGTIRGDVVVVDGTLRVPEGGRITGNVRLADSRILDRDGEIEGSVVEVVASSVRGDEDLRDQLREELRRELRNEVRAAARARSDRNDGWSFLRPFRDIGRGIAGVLGVLLNTAVVALLGWAVVFFAPDNLTVVAETVRRSPGRSAVVGMAGTFLLLPVWILGGLALVLTLVGIFALPFWIALFPLAVAAAVGLGIFAVAAGLGEHLARHRYPFLDWVRSSNAYTLVTGGLVVLAAPFLLANVMEMAVILGFLEGLLTFVGWMMIVSTMCVGFGAVLITRGGRRPDFYRSDPFDDEPDWPDDLGTPSPRTGGPSDGDWFETGTAGTASATTAGPDTATAKPDATATVTDTGSVDESTGHEDVAAGETEGSDEASAEDDSHADDESRRGRP